MGNASSDVLPPEQQDLQSPADDLSTGDWTPDLEPLDESGVDEDAAAAQSTGIDTPEVLMLKGQIEQLEHQQVAQQAEFLRVQAEAQNIRRRAQKDIENAHKFALDGFIQALLPVVDSLEQGVAMLNADDEALKPAREGALLTLKMLLDALAKQKVEPLSPLHEPFNPEQHQAMTLQPSDEHAPNTVLNVLQKGYLLHGRVLRPALVVVAKAATSS